MEDNEKWQRIRVATAAAVVVDLATGGERAVGCVGERRKHSTAQNTDGGNKAHIHITYTPFNPPPPPPTNLSSASITPQTQVFLFFCVYVITDTIKARTRVVHVQYVRIHIHVYVVEIDSGSCHGRRERMWGDAVSIPLWEINTSLTRLASSRGQHTLACSYLTNGGGEGATRRVSRPLEARSLSLALHRRNA
jgi:hypothetical protein